MFNKSKNEKITYGIIGLGRFGGALAEELAKNGAELIVIDRDEEKIRRMRDYTENAFIVHSLDKSTLFETGIHGCDIAVVCIGEQLDTSILTTLNLVGMGIPKVISKAQSPEHGEILEKLGAEVVYPERDMALRLANRLETSKFLDIIALSEKINISKLPVPDSFVEKTVVETDLRGKFNLNIIAIETKDTVIEVITPDYVFKKSDVLFVSGSKDGFLKLDEKIEKGIL